MQNIVKIVPFCCYWLSLHPVPNDFVSYLNMGEKHSICRFWYFMWFEASTGGPEMYSLQIMGWLLCDNAISFSKRVVKICILTSSMWKLHFLCLSNGCHCCHILLFFLPFNSREMVSQGFNFFLVVWTPFIWLIVYVYSIFKYI